MEHGDWGRADCFGLMGIRHHEYDGTLAAGVRATVTFDPV